MTYILFTNVIFTSCLLFHTFILRYDKISPEWDFIEQWSTYATAVDAGYQDSLEWMKQNCQVNVDHHNILAGWCLSLSQRYLIMFTKVCEQLSDKLSVKHFVELLAMMGLDAADTRVFNRCIIHKSPKDDLHGNQIFTLVGMKMTLDCEKMWSMRPIQFNETALMCKNPTISSTAKGWDVKTHFNWFDKRVYVTKLKGKPSPMFGCKMNNLRKAQESVWINKT